MERDGKMKRSKGQGHIFKRGATYYLQLRVNGKKIVKSLHDETGTPVRSQRDAEKERDRIMSAYAAKDEETLRRNALNALMNAEEKAEAAADLANPPLRIKDAWNAYLAHHDRPQDSGERTLRDYAGYFSKFTASLKANHPEMIFMRDVSAETAAEYATFLKKSGASPNTFNKHLFFTKLIYRVLRKEIRAAEPPFEGIRPQKLTTQGRRELTVDEIRNVLETAEGDLGLLLGLGAFTGLRLGDACTIKWGEIDLARRIIRRTLNKTGKAVLIGIPQVLLDKLNEIPRQERKGYLLPKFAELYQDENTRPQITARIQAHFRECGIDTWKEGTGGGADKTGKRAVVEVGFHSLRHSYISLLAAAGAPMALVQKQVGHSSMTMTDHYLHMNESGARQLADSLTLTGKAATGIEPEREKLAELAKTADIEKIKQAIELLKGGEAGKK